MSEVNGTVEAPSVNADASESVQQLDVAEGHKPPREQRYRVERNEARTALEAAQERISGLLKADVQRVAGELLAQGSDVFLADGDVSRFLTDDGSIDYDLVREEAKAVLAERPGLRRNSPAFDPSQGHGGEPKVVEKPSWGVLLTTDKNFGS